MCLQCHVLGVLDMFGIPAYGGCFGLPAVVKSWTKTT